MADPVTLPGAGIHVHGDPIPVEFSGDVEIAVSQSNGETGAITMTADNRLRVDVRQSFEDRDLFTGSAWALSSPFSQSAW